MVPSGQSTPDSEGSLASTALPWLLSLAFEFSSNPHPFLIFYKGPTSLAFPSPNPCYSSGSIAPCALCSTGRKIKFTSSWVSVLRDRKEQEEGINSSWPLLPPLLNPHLKSTFHPWGGLWIPQHTEKQGDSFQRSSVSSFPSEFQENTELCLKTILQPTEGYLIQAHWCQTPWNSSSRDWMFGNALNMDVWSQ